MTEQTKAEDVRERDMEKTANWTMWADGYRSCPWCMALVHPHTAELHRDRCVARLIGKAVGAP